MSIGRQLFGIASDTVELSTFGSEFIAMKIAFELIAEGLRYKLWMMVSW
jgi:hypothetical protein